MQVKALLPIGNTHAMYFFCGPKPWMQQVAYQLVSFGVSKEQLAFESFGPAQDILP